MSLSSFSSMGKYLNVSAGGSSGGGSVPSSGLVFHLSADTDLLDKSASSVPITNTSCTVNTSSMKTGTGCMAFSIGQNIKIGSFIPFGTSYGSTFSYWFKLTTLTLGTNNGTCNNFTMFMGWLPLLTSINKQSASTFTLSTTIYGSYGVPDTSSLNVNTWYHICYVFGGTSASPLLSLYINNVLSGTQNSTTLAAFKQAASNATNWGSGLNVYSYLNGGESAFGLQGSNFTGFIDSVRVYNRILTTGEVTALYNET